MVVIIIEYEKHHPILNLFWIILSFFAGLWLYIQMSPPFVFYIQNVCLLPLLFVGNSIGILARLSLMVGHI